MEIYGSAIWFEDFAQNVIDFFWDGVEIRINPIGKGPEKVPVFFIELLLEAKNPQIFEKIAEKNWKNIEIGLKWVIIGSFRAGIGPAGSKKRAGSDSKRVWG